jgi:hypothetical protein
MLLTAGSGGLLGIVGAIGTKFMAYKEKKLAFAHEIAMQTEDRLNMEMEITLAQTKGAIDLELQESENDAKSLQTAINAEGAISGTSQWVADLRGSLRPILTYGLVVISSLVIALDQSNPWIGELIFLASTAVTFWFGSRPASRK